MLTQPHKKTGKRTVIFFIAILSCHGATYWNRVQSRVPILDRTLVYAADGLLITAVTDRYPERDKSRIRVRSEPGWRVTETATGHDAMMCSKRTAPTVPRRRSDGERPLPRHLSIDASWANNAQYSVGNEPARISVHDQYSNDRALTGFVDPPGLRSSFFSFRFTRMGHVACCAFTTAQC
jgi:hypothetical protein